jgi:hypothetical protein
MWVTTMPSEKESKDQEKIESKGKNQPGTTPTGTKPSRTAEEQDVIDWIAQTKGKEYAEAHAEFILAQARAFGDL